MTGRPESERGSAAKAGAPDPAPEDLGPPPLLDLGIAAISLCGGVALIVYAQGFRAMIPNTVIGPGLLLTVCGAVFTLLSGFMGLRAVRQLRQVGQRMPDWSTLLFAALVPGLLVATLALTPLVGFLPAAALASFALMKASGARWLTALVATVLLSAAVYGAFVEIMRVPLPGGALF